MAKCDYEVQLTDTGEILRCVMDEHPGRFFHSSAEAEFRKIDEGRFIVRHFSDGLRPTREGVEV